MAKFYIDFEATQPEQEIISIGVTAENGAEFYTDVKPQLSKVSPFVTQLTGLTNERLENAPLLGDALFDLHRWCKIVDPEEYNWEFYSYGDADKGFVEASMPAIKSNRGYEMACILLHTLKDYSETTKKYFRGSCSLLAAYNFLETKEDGQRHNALDDARMLNAVAVKVDNSEALSDYPFERNVGLVATKTYNFPKGRFYMKALGKNAKEREFCDIHEAIEWLITNQLGAKVAEEAHRDRIAQRIMKAIRQNKTYNNYKWRRVK